MSATLTIALQLFYLSFVYFLITFLIPHIVLGKTLLFKDRYERFLMYGIIGNFYVVNLVYLLELLHISHQITLILFTLIPCFIIKIKLENIPFFELVINKVERLRRLSGGQLTVKSIHDSNKKKRYKSKKQLFEAFHKVFLKNIFDVILIIGIIWTAFITYGKNLFINYGYKLTDVVVHNLWINKLSDNEIFSRGVYPFGFHNVVYYIHEVFRIDTYVVLRLFSIVGVVWLVLFMLCFLKQICKNKYLPYIACYLFTIIRFYGVDTYKRFSSLIPQEYGLLFLFPTVLCGFEFFRAKRREEHGMAAKKARMYLVLFMMSFSLALTVHFYGAIICGIFCFSMAIGYGRLFVKKTYFKSIIVTVGITLAVSVMPMLIAYLFGTELEYSLNWGLGVITGRASSGPSSSEILSSVSSSYADESDDEEKVVYSKEYYVERFGKAAGSFTYFVMTLESYISYEALENSSLFLNVSIIISFFIMIAMGLAISLSRNRDNLYGMTVMSTGVFMILMTILVSSGGLHLVSIMDINRASIYYALFAGVSIVVFADCVMYLCLQNTIKIEWIRSAISLFMVIVFLSVTLGNGVVKQPITTKGLESNDAIICLGKIIADNPDDTWTIVSANDESNMVFGHGYHYELIDFLRGMEYIGSSGWIRIPTKTTFFFIEKNPIDYYISWDGSGTSISEEYAHMQLPVGNNRSLYEGVNRWICMSRFYYWANTFSELYPNEVSVYYETDDFLCIRINQNPYRLFNFAIDYGYNVY